MTIYSIFKSKKHFKIVCKLCKTILGCDIKSTDHLTIEYFENIKDYFNNPNLINSERFLMATEALIKTSRSNIMSSPIIINENEKRLGHRVENIITNICINNQFHPIKSYINSYICNLFPHVIIHGILPTFYGPCNDISYLLELDGKKFIFPIEIKSTNRNNMSFLGNKSLTGPCGLILVIGYDYIIRNDDIKIKGMALIQPNEANSYMKKTWKVKKILSSNSTKYIHDFIDDDFKQKLEENGRWYGDRPSFYKTITYQKYSEHTGPRYIKSDFFKKRKTNNGSLSMNWRQPDKFIN